MKKITILISIIALALLSNQCSKPDIFKNEAKLKIENTSSSNYITGVYYGTVGPGNENKLKNSIGPGESKTFTLDIEDHDEYDIKVTSDMTGFEELAIDHYYFLWDETYVIELENEGWYNDSPW